MSQTILHLIPNANLGGIEKDLYYILCEESGIYKHEVWVFGMEGPMSTRWEEKGAKVDSLGILNENPFRFSKLLRRKAVNWDGVGIMCWSPIRLPIVIAAFLNFHGRMMVHMGNPVNTTIKTRTWNLLVRHFSSNVFKTKLFCCSEHVLRSVRTDKYLSNFPVCVSYNPVNIPDVNPYDDSQWKSNSLGMLARMDAIKDFDTVIKSMQHLPANIRLELGGDGTERQRLEELVQQLGIKNVDFLGFVTQTYDRLRQWKFFVYGTTLSEGLGNVVIEAMANGLPCILPDLPMMVEIGGDCAIYYTPGNALDCAVKVQSLMQDKDLSMRLSEKAYNRAKKTFHPKKYYQDRVGYLTE